MQIAKRSLILASVAVLSLTGAACGGSDEGTSETTSSGSEDGGNAGGETISVVALDNEFDPTSIEVPSDGEVTIEFTNEGAAPHTFTVPGSDVDTGTVEAGQSATVTLSAEDGTEFVCTIHLESDDMKGEIASE